MAAGVAASATAVSGMVGIWLGSRSPALADDAAGSAANALFVVGMTALAAVGALLVQRGRHRVMGWLLVGTGLANVLGRLVGVLAIAAHEADGDGAEVLGWLTNWSWLPGQALALLLILRFPDGRLPGHRWRLLEWAVLGWVLVLALATALVPGPLGAEQLEPLANPLGVTALDGVLNGILSVGFAVMPVVLLVVVAAPVMRWRRAPSDQRRQLRAVALALAFLVVASALAVATGAGVVAEGLAWLVLPGSIAYAVARHDLWDVDLRRRFDRLRQVREEERVRLQRDLHDSLGPLLGSVTMRVEAVRNLLDADAPRAEVDRVLVSIGGDAEAAVVEVRRFIDELGPSALADTDLVTALRRLVDGYSESGVPASLRVDPELPALAPATELALYRVASEALRNVARHAQATRCQVALRCEDGDVVLEVVDDGVGLRGQPPGVGRRAMADRVTALGGVFSLADSAVGGVHLSARLQGAGG